MERAAVAYLANGRVVVGTIVRTTTGLGLEVDPAALGGSPSVESVADALARALDGSARIVPHPARHEWKGFFLPFVRSAGVRSFKTFMTGARRVEVRAVGGELLLTLNRNLGARHGFDVDPEEEVRLPGQDMQGAAAAVLRLLAEV